MCEESQGRGEHLHGPSWFVTEDEFHLGEAFHRVGLSRECAWMGEVATLLLNVYLELATGNGRACGSLGIVVGTSSEIVPESIPVLSP